MRLRGNLYRLREKDLSGDRLRFEIAMIPDCAVFKAHFPGQPVLPGACLIEICSELLGEKNSPNTLKISAVRSAKFLNVVTPEAGLCLEMKVSESEAAVAAEITVSASDTVCAKLSLNCTSQ